MTTYSDFTDGHHYRARYNPAFVQRVLERRKKEARKAELQAQQQAALRLEMEINAARIAKAAERAEREQHIVDEFRIIDLSHIEPERRPARAIIDLVSQAHGISYAEIMGRSRVNPIVAARQAAMFEVHKRRPDLTLPQLGKIFGKDHTTILHAIRKIEAQRAGEQR